MAGHVLKLVFAAAVGSIRIKSSFFFLQWLFLFFKPTISIDGAPPEKHAWGESTHAVPAGEHTVHVEIPYFGTKVGKATETVTVAEGETVALTYKPPWIVFMSGKLRPAAT